MPAAAASLSSSSRQRKALAQGRRGPGRGLERGMSNRRSSERSLMAHTGGSNRNLMGGSQRNLMRPLESSINARDVEGLGASLPALNERRDSDLEAIRSGLDDSTKSNPELFLTNRRQSLDEESSFRLELRRQRSSKQSGHKGSEKAGGGQNNLHSDEPTQALDLDNPPSEKLPPLKDKNSLPENNNTNPTNENRCPPWYLEPFNTARKIIGKMVNLPWVQNTVLFLIMVNAVMMGIATFPSIKSNPEVLGKFELCDQIFLIIFTVESSMQLIYHGWTLFKDGFLVFDLLIVVLSWALEGTQVFRAFRIFRAMRLITRIDTLKNLVLALFSVVPKMTAIFMLLLLIFYIFAVMFTQLFKGMHDEDLVEWPYFETIYGSLFTLFQMMTLDEWAEILLQIQVTYSWAWMPFVVFIIITGFVVVNLIIAVICDAVHVLGKDDKEGLHGYDSDDNPLASNIQSQCEEEYIPPANTTDLRIEQLQMQLDDMVLVQEQMKETIELLIKRLRENAAREAALLAEQKHSGEQHLCVRESRTNSLGGAMADPPDLQRPRAKLLQIVDESGEQLLGSKTM